MDDASTGAHCDVPLSSCPQQVAGGLRLRVGAAAGACDAVAGTRGVELRPSASHAAAGVGPGAESTQHAALACPNMAHSALQATLCAARAR